MHPCWGCSFDDMTKVTMHKIVKYHKRNQWEFKRNTWKSKVQSYICTYLVCKLCQPPPLPGLSVLIEHLLCVTMFIMVWHHFSLDEQVLRRCIKYNHTQSILAISSHAYYTCEGILKREIYIKTNEQLSWTL